MGKITLDIDEINVIIKEYLDTNVTSVTYFYDADFTESGWDISKCHFEVIELVEDKNTKEIIEKKQYISYDSFINIIKHRYKYKNINITRIQPRETDIEISYRKDKTLKKYKSLY